MDGERGQRPGGEAGGGGSFHRPHPLFILQSLSRFFYLLVLPLARGLFTLPAGGVGAWLRGSWLDIAVLLLILFMGVVRWRRTAYRFDERGLLVVGGIWARRESFLAAEQIADLEVRATPFLGLLRAARLQVTARGGSGFTLLVHRREAQRITRLQRGRGEGPFHRVGWWGQVLLAVGSSNAFAGLVLAVTFLSRLGSVAGRELPRRLVGDFQQLVSLVAFGLPPVAVTVAALLLLGWLVVFGVGFFRHWGFAVGRILNTICINSGFITKKREVFPVKSVATLVLRQTVLTHMLGMDSAFLEVEGQKRRQAAPLLPPLPEERMGERLGHILPELLPAPLTHRPRGWTAFLGMPTGLCILSLAGYRGLLWLLPLWQPLLEVLAVAALVLSLWLLVVGALAWGVAGVEKAETSYTICYQRGYYIQTVVISAAKVAQIQLRQNPFQRKRGSCTVLLHTTAGTHHRCPGLDLGEMMELFGKQAGHGV